MAQVGIKNNRPWLLGNSQFQFVPPWFKGGSADHRTCYYCDAPITSPLIYQENPPGYLCPNCFAPIYNIDNTSLAQSSCGPVTTAAPCCPQTLLQPVRENCKTGYVSSYPGLFYISIISGTTTAFSTLCLLRQGGPSWLFSLIAGGLSTASTLSGYYASRRFVSAQPGDNSLYTNLRVLESNPDLLKPIITDSVKRYQFYQLVKSLTQVNQQTTDPAVRELQQNPAFKNMRLAQTSLPQALPILYKEESGIVRSSLDDICTAIPSDITIVLKNEYTCQDVSIIFSALSLAKEPLNLMISAQTDKAFEFKNITFSHNIKALTFENIAISSLPETIWNVGRDLTLKNVTELDYLPELPVGVPDQPLTLTILNSSIKSLPKTLIRRKIQNLDLTGCANINNLPATLCQPLKDNTIQTLNLTGTNVWSTYQRNIVLNDQVRQTLGSFDPKIPHELFCNQALICPAPCCPQPQCCPQPSSVMLLCMLGLMTPFALLMMVFDHCFWRKKHEGITNKNLFWAMYIAGGAALAFWLNHGQPFSGARSRQLLQLKAPRKARCFHGGDSIFDIYALIKHQGRECVNQDTYDWDYLWGQIFDQTDLYFYAVPAPVTTFIETFINAVQGNFEGQLGQHLSRLCQYRGRDYLRNLTSMPFYQMVKTLEVESYRFPVILNAVQDMRNCIGKPGKQYHTIELSLQQIVETQMCVPDPDPEIMQALFALIAAGYHVDLSLDWHYNDRPQPLQFDTLPLATNIDRLAIVNAYLNYVPAQIWWVRDEIHLHNVSGLYDLPEIPDTAPRLPLRLGLTNTSMARLPFNLGHRPLLLLDLDGSSEVRSLPEAVKTGITANRIKRLVLTGTSFVDHQKVYEGDALKALVNEDIFEMPMCEVTVQSPLICKENVYDYAPPPMQRVILPPQPLCESVCATMCAPKIDPCCDSEGLSPTAAWTLRAVSTVGCVALGALALWKLKPAIVVNKPLQPIKDSIAIEPTAICTPEPLPVAEFDFFTHPDFSQHADMLLGYIVQDPWAYEALQKFIVLMPTLDHGQNWSCYECLHNILDRRLDFIQDDGCAIPQCSILVNSINIRYQSGVLCPYMVDALQGQSIKNLLKPEVILHLNLFGENTNLDDGVNINLREQMVILLYALGYTAPGKAPEDLFAYAGPVCFIQL